MLQAHNFISWIQDWSIQSLYSDVSKVLEAGDRLPQFTKFHTTSKSGHIFLFSISILV